MIINLYYYIITLPIFRSEPRTKGGKKKTKKKKEESSEDEADEEEKEGVTEDAADPEPEVEESKAEEAEV